MKALRSTCLGVVLLLLLPLRGQAQPVYTGLLYQVALPTSDTKDFIDKVSFRGVGVEARKPVTSKFTVGASLNWNVFHSVVKGTVPIDVGAVTGSQNRIINSFPLLGTAHYYFASPEDEANNLMGFLGLGTGVMFVQTKNEIGSFTVKDENWHFVVAPEFGLGFESGRGMYVVVSARYNYAFKSGGQQHGYLSLNLGVFSF